MMRKLNLLLVMGLLALLLSGCGAASSADGANGAPDATEPVASATASQPGGSVIMDGGIQATSGSSSPSAPPSASEPPVASSPEQSLKQSAQEVMDILRSRDLDRLAKVIDPELGLRFAPYPHIDRETAQLFKADELPGFKDTDKLVWGAYDGSGEPIELTFRDYFEKFVYDQDFASAPNVSVNKLIGEGNVPFNGMELYSDASYIEFHYAGFDKKNEGMDWESLILVMQPNGESWKLCAIVHAQWTI